MIHHLTSEQIVPASLEDVWTYFSTPLNLNEMTPPDMRFEIVRGGDTSMYPGQLIEYRVKAMPLFTTTWLTEIAHVEEKAYFVDEQRIGPYRFWYHEHRFAAIEDGTRIRDHVAYRLPFGPLGDLVHALWVKKKLAGIFDYRREKVEELFGA